MDKKIVITIIFSIILGFTIFATAQVQQSKNIPIFSKYQYELSSVRADNPAIVWSKTFGTRGRDICWSLNKTTDGGYILIGETTSFGSKGGDAWLIKLESTGDEQWNKTYGGHRGDYGFDGIQTRDNGYIIAGGTKSFSRGDHDTWLVKTDAFGNELWNRSYGGVERDQGYAVIQVSDGGFVICGGSGSFSEGANDYWMIKTDDNGEEIWNMSYGGKGYDWGYDVIEIENAELLFTGGTDTSFKHNHILDIGLIKLNQGGQILWDTSFNKPPAKQRWDEGYSVIRTEDKGFLIGGIAHTYHWFEDGEGDGWIIKTDEKGKMIWEKTFGGDLCDGISTVKKTNDGGYILSGWTYSYGVGDADIWLLKTDDVGNIKWDLTIGGDEREWSMLHTVESIDDCYLVAGTTNSFGAGGSDIFLAKIQEPSLNIVFEGGIGFSFTVTNTGDVNVYDLNWMVNISNTIFLGTSFQGSIEILKPNEEYTIRNNNLIVGFGSGCIRFSVDGLGKTIPCLTLGPLILRI